MRSPIRILIALAFVLVMNTNLFAGNVKEYHCSGDGPDETVYQLQIRALQNGEFVIIGKLFENDKMETSYSFWHLAKEKISAWKNPLFSWDEDPSPVGDGVSPKGSIEISLRNMRQPDGSLAWELIGVLIPENSPWKDWFPLDCKKLDSEAKERKPKK